MEQRQIKIKEALTIEYLDFMEYCASIEKEYVSDLSTVDYIAFRTQYGASKEYIAEIKKALADFSLLSQETVEVQPNESIECQPIGIIGANDIVISKPTSQPTLNITEKEISSSNEKEDVTEHNTFVLSVEEDNDERTDISAAASNVHLEEKFGAIYGIDASWYKDYKINNSELSVRSQNALTRANITTVEDLFNCSELEIRRIKNLGVKSIDEILAFVNQKSIEYAGNSFNENHETIFTGNTNCKAIKSNLLFRLGEEVEHIEMSEEDENALEQLMEAVDVIGEEMALQIIKKPETITYFCDIFSEMLREARIEEEIKKKLPIGFIEKRKKEKIGSYVKSFMAYANNEKENALFDKNISFAVFPSFAANKIKNATNSRDIRRTYDQFINWLHSDINALVFDTFSFLLEDERAKAVLEYRSQGETLTQVGERFGITRERIRQIESKAVRKIRTRISARQRDFIMFIFALNGGEKLLNKITFSKYIPKENAEILWSFVCAGYLDTSCHTYSREYNSIIFPKEFEYGIKYSQTIASDFPDMVPIEDMEPLIEKAVQNQGVLEEKLRMDIERTFIKYKSIYSKKKLSKQEITNYILKTRFKNGYKIADEVYYNRFLTYVKEDICDEDLNFTPRGLDAKIPLHAVLCDRGTYIHTDYFDVPASVIDTVNAYIESSPRNVLPYGEIFENNKDLFIGTIITNKYCLQGALKKYGCTYTLRKDYITKDADLSFTDEFQNFVKECGTAHKSEIFSMFPTLDDLSLGNVTVRCPEVIYIDNGYYMHSSLLDIKTDDYDPIRAYLTNAVKELPINSRKAYETICNDFPEFISRNNISDKSMLYGVLQYMFSNEFSFSRPYIAQAGTDSVTNQSMLLAMLEGFDSIQIDDLMDMVQEHNLSCRSTSYVAQLISPIFMLADENTFMRTESTGITQEVIEAVCDIVDDHMKYNDYFLTMDVDDFLWYPSINIEWNVKLLDSIIIASGKYDYIPLQSSRQGRNSIIVISEKYKDMQYQEFVLAILEDAYDKGFFSSKNEMKNWLIEKHLVEKSLPNFLESTQYYFTDDTGFLRKK